jgi:hypothetical protein
MGVVNRGKYVRPVSGRNATVAYVLVTFGRGHSWWKARAWAIDVRPGVEDRLYDNAVRAIHRRAKELGWL